MLEPHTTVFISDIHLSADNTALQHLFIDFLQGPASEASRLYILGDLFDVWVGKDIQTDFHNIICKALNTLSAKGTQLFFMAGNRDFLIEKSTLKKANLQKLSDPTVIDLHGTPTLLTHGDKLCTQDVAYQRYRKIAQNPITRFIFLCLPKSVRGNIARKLRQKSQAYQQNQSLSILDVTESAVEDLMSRYGVTQMIHGHVHRPKIHTHGQRRRLVLGDWHTKVSFIMSSPTQTCLATYDPQNGIQKIN